MATTIEIPKRAFFKAVEVCSIAGVQPYVLTSWAVEFPSLSGKKRKSGSRVYGRGEVELVLRIKELLYIDGLTLGAARRKVLGEEVDAGPEADALLEEPLGDNDRARLAEVRRGLRSILELLSGNGDGIVEPDEAKPIAQPKRARPKAKRAARTRGRAASAKATSRDKRRTA